MNKNVFEDKWFLNNHSVRTFLGGPVVKNPPTNAGGMGSIPGLGRSHMPRSHNYWRPCALGPVLCNKRSHLNEKRVHQDEEESPPAATRESLSATTKAHYSRNT